MSYIAEYGIPTQKRITVGVNTKTSNNPNMCRLRLQTRYTIKRAERLQSYRCHQKTCKSLIISGRK